MHTKTTFTTITKHCRLNLLKHHNHKDHHSHKIKDVSVAEMDADDSVKSESESGKIICDTVWKNTVMTLCKFQSGKAELCHPVY